MEAIPILLFIAPSWLVAVLYYWLSMRPHLLSPEMQVLNGNLAKIGLYWSNSDGSFRELSEGAVERDAEQARRHFWTMTTLLSLLSLVGMLLLIAIFMSGHPRLERNTFNSALAKDPALPAGEVSKLVEEIKSFI